MARILCYCFNKLFFSLVVTSKSQMYCGEVEIMCEVLDIHMHEVCDKADS